MRFVEPIKILASVFALLFLMMGNIAAAHAGDRTRSCAITVYDFFWSGQIAGFIVKGRFAFDENSVPDNGIVREQDLLSIDVSFYDPQGNLLRTYEDNHDYALYPTFNFAFDTLTKQILQEGTWNVDDDELRLNNGFLMGEGDPDLRGEPGSQVGLAFWSRPRDGVTPHLHVDDWDLDPAVPGAGEFGFPIGFSSHEDVAFFYRTTQNRVDDGRVGTAYFDPSPGVNNLASDLEDVGQRIRVVLAEISPNELRKYRTCQSSNSRGSGDVVDDPSSGRSWPD